MTAHTRKTGALRRFWNSLGPGVITGAADDDPSGIATYSIAGAQLGTSMLWTALLSWPLMVAVQLECARIGMVTGSGLMAALRVKFPRWLVIAAAIGLLAANVINIGADLSAMSDSAGLLTGVKSSWWMIATFGVLIASCTIYLRYATIARVLKWLCISLFAYIIAGFDLGPRWSTIAHATFVPSWPRSHDEWSTLVALLGTTISPYLFFWQASEEIEEEKKLGHFTIESRQGATKAELESRHLDVTVGGFFSNVVMFFIILTTALTLHAHGLTNISTSADVAKALEPLAGKFSTTLYTAGVIGTGLLAIPVLAGSAAYALAEIFDWRQGIDAEASLAPAFYAVIAVAIAGGAAMDLVKLNPIHTLYWTAVINGLLSPILLVGILAVAADRTLMRGQPASRVSLIVVAIATVLMTGAGIALFVV
jgi:NRAMP (natural resistance-associated macrophage protein)-like metal ion transporter